MKLLLPSPVDKVNFQNHTVYIKRDDLIDRDFSGNKARKFHYFLEHDFSHIKKVVSYGSSQSNAMYSLSTLCKIKGWEFEYYVDHISDYLRENPHGNYLGAIQNGMQLRVGTISEEVVGSSEEVLFIQEGGRQRSSEYGIKLLAQEIIEWQKQSGVKKLNIFLPSGTGTTALFLEKAFSVQRSAFRNDGIKVYTCACVGDDEYLKKQFFELESDERYHPTILSLDKKHHFGKLYRENYEIWIKLQKDIGIEFDLLYDPLGWRVMMKHIKSFEGELMYIHQGGVLGNESMLPRYQRKYNIG